MANYSFYEVHIRAEKKAALMIYQLLPDAFGDKQITEERRDGDRCVLHVSGACQWELSAHRHSTYDGPPADLSALTEEQLRSGDFGADALPFALCNLCVLSELFGCEIMTQEFCPESPGIVFRSFKNGEQLCLDVDEGKWYEWDKKIFPTFEEFCCANNIGEGVLEESDFDERDNGVCVCLHFGKQMPFAF